MSASLSLSYALLSFLWNTNGRINLHRIRIISRRKFNLSLWTSVCSIVQTIKIHLTDSLQNVNKIYWVTEMQTIFSFAFSFESEESKRSTSTILMTLGIINFPEDPPATECTCVCVCSHSNWKAWNYCVTGEKWSNRNKKERRKFNFLFDLVHFVWFSVHLPFRDEFFCSPFSVRPFHYIYVWCFEHK